MKKSFIICMLLIITVTSFVTAIALPVAQLMSDLSDLQTFLLMIVAVVCACIVAAASFEYIFTTTLHSFLKEVKQSWNVNGSFESVKKDTLPIELKEMLETFEAITSESIARVKELEAKGGYSDTYYNLISTVSHQLRTPISGLRWALGSIQDDASKGAPLDSAMIADAVGAVTRIGDIIEELLVGVNEGGARKKVYEPIDVERCAQDVIAESALFAQQQKIELRIEKKTPLIPLVRGVSYEIRFIFHCLVTNALTYAREGSEVTITMGQEGDNVYMKVHNFGLIIPEKEKVMIFSQFNRGAEAIKTNPNGSGLGLYLSRDIILRHGGSIVFESDEQAGTSFIVKLPLSNKGQLENSIKF